MNDHQGTVKPCGAHTGKNHPAPESDQPIPMVQPGDVSGFNPDAIPMISPLEPEAIQQEPAGIEQAAPDGPVGASTGHPPAPSNEALQSIEQGLIPSPSEGGFSHLSQREDFSYLSQSPENSYLSQSAEAKAMRQELGKTHWQIAKSDVGQQLWKATAKYYTPVFLRNDQSAIALFQSHRPEKSDRFFCPSSGPAIHLLIQDEFLPVKWNGEKFEWRGRSVPDQIAHEFDENLAFREWALSRLEIGTLLERLENLSGNDLHLSKQSPAARIITYASAIGTRAIQARQPFIFAVTITLHPDEDPGDVIQPLRRTRINGQKIEFDFLSVKIPEFWPVGSDGHQELGPDGQPKKIHRHSHNLFWGPRLVPGTAEWNCLVDWAHARNGRVIMNDADPEVPGSAKTVLDAHDNASRGRPHNKPGIRYKHKSIKLNCVDRRFTSGVIKGGLVGFTDYASSMSNLGGVLAAGAHLIQEPSGKATKLQLVNSSRTPGLKARAEEILQNCRKAQKPPRSPGSAANSRQQGSRL